jgi:endonuclease III-like uncharacterized protein
VLTIACGAQYWGPVETRFEVILGACPTQSNAWIAVERSLANLRTANALTLEILH